VPAIVIRAVAMNMVENLHAAKNSVLRATVRCRTTYLTIRLHHGRRAISCQRSPSAEISSPRAATAAALSRSASSWKRSTSICPRTIQLSSRAAAEAARASSRIKAALAARARGVKLGGNRGTVITKEIQAKGVAVRQERSAAQPHDLATDITEVRMSGASSLREIAAGLNAGGIPRARGQRGR
jgi:hypothetical protein